MDWDEIICIESGEYPQVYLAEIIGIHPRYRFERHFLSYHAQTFEAGQKRRYLFSIDDNGLFEVCIRFYDQKTKRLIRRLRTWYLMDEGDCHELNYFQALSAAATLSRNSSISTTDWNWSSIS